MEAIGKGNKGENKMNQLKIDTIFYKKIYAPPKRPPTIYQK